MFKLVKPTPKHKDLFDRLAQLYAYDFSEIVGKAIGPDGIYSSHECFTKIWTDENRHARLIMKGDEPAGFAIVHQIGEHEYDMEQFFVLRKFRRSGAGRATALELFSTFKGKWTVEQIAENKAAQAFWRSAISEYTKGNFEDTNGDDPVQSFIS